MNELEQFVSILNEIAAAVEKVNPAIYDLTNSLANMAKSFTSSEKGLKNFISMLDHYVATIQKLSSGDQPILNISKETVADLTTVSTALKEVLTDTERLSKTKVTGDVLQSLIDAATKSKKELDDLEKGLRNIGAKGRPQEIIEITNPNQGIDDFDVYAQELERKIPGIMNKLKEKYNISQILEEPKHVGNGIYRVVAEQIGEEGQEAKKVAFYIDKLGNAHNNLAYASKLSKSEIDDLIEKYKSLQKVLESLSLTEENILSYSKRPDLGEDVLKVRLGDEKSGFRKDVFVDQSGRYGFTQAQFEKQFSPEQFNNLLKTYPELNKFVEQHNLTVENLRKAYKDAAKGVTEFSFVAKDANGVIEKLNLSLDENGRVVDRSKNKMDEQSRAYYNEMKSAYPNIDSQLFNTFGNTNTLSIRKLNDGIFKVSGYKEVNGEVQKLTVYIDKLGKVQENLNNVSRVSRDEIGALAAEYQKLRQKVFDYGYSLEDIKKIEKLEGGNVVKVTLNNQDLGKLTLYADNLDRVSTTLRGMKNQIPTSSLEALANKYRDLNSELEKYGATLENITKINKRGNITEIQFSAYDEEAGRNVTRKLYGDAQGRIVDDYRLASQLSAEETMQLAYTYKQAFDAAEQFGAGLSNLTKVIKDEKTGITELVFAIKDYNGNIKEMSLFTDEAGRVGYSKQDLGGKGFSEQDMKFIAEAYDPAIKKAEEYGYRLEHLKKVHIEASTGITRLTFAMRGEAGELKTLTVAIDKYGNVLRDVQRKYQGFLDGVMRNTMEAAKWAVAIQLTYAPLQKLNELLETSIDNQSKLADIAIGLNMEMKDMGGVFRDVAEVASSTATPLNEALEGFSAAYRSTAGLGDQAKRTSVALDLLKSSLTLSKLAAIDQAEAIDILVGALRQANIPLDKSTEILDKWIAVSKNSQVGINDLAEAYSVVGSAAINSGFDIDKLNGIIATLVESTTYSGKEVGNILRTFISNIQTDEAQRQLNELGISVRNLTTGEFRDFSDILDEIASKYSAGLISDDKLKELSRTLAGGSRRSAPFITMVTQYGKALQTAEVSSAAFGESQKALDTKLQTAKSSIVELSNAFQVLAETMGDDGGVLSLFTLMTDALTEIVKLMDSFVSYTGKAGVAMMTLLPMLGYLNRSGRLGGFVAPLNSYLGKRFGTSGKVYTSEGWVEQPKYKITPNMVMTGVTGAALLAGNAYQYATGDEYQKEQAIGSTVGMGAGALLAFAFGSPEAAPILMSAGSAIGNAFVKTVNEQGKSIAESIAEYQNYLSDKNKQEEETSKDSAKSAEEKFFDSFGTRLLGKTLQLSVNTFGKLFGDEDLVRKWNAGGSYRYGLLDLAAQGAFGEEKQRLALEVLEAARVESSEFKSDKIRIENPQTELEVKARITKDANSKEFSSLTAELEKETKQAFNAGTISAAQYKKELESISNLSESLPFYYTVLGDQLKQVGFDTKTSMEGLKKLSEVYIKGTEDEKEGLTTLIGELEEVENKILEMNKQGLSIPVELKMQEKDLKQQVIDYTNRTLENIHVRNFKSPQIIKATDLTEEQAMEAYELAKKKMEEKGKKLEEVGALTMDEWIAYVNNLQDMFAEFNDGLLRLKGIERWAWDSSIQEMEDMGKIKTSSTSQFNIQSVDFTSARAGEFQSLVTYFENYLKTNFPEYKLNPQDVGIIYQDYVTDVLHADNLAIQMALNKMLEIEQKQLDGIYNLPQGSSFYVPYQAWAMQFNAQGGGGGLPNVSATSTDTETVVKEVQKDNAEIENALSELSGIPEWDRMPSDFILVPKKEAVDTSKLPIEPYESKKDVTGEYETTNSLIERILGLLGNGVLLSLTNILPNNYGGNLNELEPKSSQKMFEKLYDLDKTAEVNFNLELTSKQTIMLDGAVLAQVVSKYLGNELLISSRGGSINKSVEVI